ncbi:MAG: pirin family protein [Woeseiaceae bacterium]|nr:pirin family protein [Woeseiaceae bacterium]
MTAHATPRLARVITPGRRSLADLDVRRALPQRSQQRVGPFIFFDHMGPADLPPGKGIDVRPHPHIGLATITYLFSGAIRHRDSLGYDQVIVPGEVNWMTAGRGVVHSERTPQAERVSGSHLHGIQAWIALPTDKEEIAPGFAHYSAKQIPQLRQPGARLTVIAGSAYGESSPVETASETLYIEADLDAGATLDLPQNANELALYVVNGELDVEGETVQSGTMAVLSEDRSSACRARSDCKLMILGGAKLPGERIVWWNFVSSHRERIELAKTDWTEGRFDRVPGETEFIPLPER